jgi:hypothetical protein
MQKPEKALKVCIPRDIGRAKTSSKEESGETESRFYDPGTGIELRKVYQLLKSLSGQILEM